MQTIPEGTIKRIHVNQHIVKANKKNGADDPCLTVKNRGTTYQGRRVVVHGPSELKQSMWNPLSCGAHIWIETRSAVTVE